MEGYYLPLIFADENGAAQKLFSVLYLFKFDFCPFQYPFDKALSASQNSKYTGIPSQLFQRQCQWRPRFKHWLISHSRVIR
jgi:hypothetical protein